MTGPEPGRYYIQLVASKQLIGADPPYYNPDYVSIITDSIADIWQVDRLDDGTYTLTIVRGTPVYTKKELVGSLNPPSTPWRIEGPENGPYTIRAIDSAPPLGWTVWRAGARKSFVTLFALRPPQDNQKWIFIPVYDN
ncbi:hypothetical protein L210DRAFT_3626836 [Boletus edulis BED1]|uniref:Uncharacterized protein n=1 Tax=Boletus edulis BED1 TaxID=1328754 RepID=A0AAD4CAR7_BOLED|nr:hypothetical protein L210DRAFT_3626836 [Boletus edulis BED1]